MKMTIETQIKALEYLKNCGIFPFSDTKTGMVFDDKFIDAAIETMHKYQKIQEIMKSKKMDTLNIGLLIPKDMACILHEIREVIE